MASQSVQEFFAKKNVFLTGGTGFVGICLIEKLLRTIPDIGTIYLLMRSKRDKKIQERLDEIKQNSVFDTLKEISSEKELEQLFSKLCPISGDVGEKHLGLTPTDRQLLCEQVNVVFHSAATLDFEATLKPTVKINLLGTRQIMELCADMRNIKCMVHVSSAYVNSFMLHANEIIYPLGEDPEKVITLAAELTNDQLLEVTPALLGNHPNTYTFTKQMAEYEVQKYETKFPCAIVRPSQICGALNEPRPGWTISKNGPQGFFMGAGMGVLRRVPVSTELINDYIPVDIVINTLIAAACHVGTVKPDKVEIYHATSSTRRPFRWNMIEKNMNTYIHTYPLKSAVWYPHLKFIPTFTWFKISAFFVHILPAIFFDTITKLSGGRPKLLRMHRNINNSLDRLRRFIQTQWTFSAEKTEELQEWLTPDDQQTYNVTLELLDWSSFFLTMVQGVRLYLCKESAASLPAAKKKESVLFAFHIIFQALVYSIFWYGTSSIFDVSLTKSIVVLPLIYFFFSIL